MLGGLAVLVALLVAGAALAPEAIRDSGDRSRATPPEASISLQSPRPGTAQGLGLQTRRDSRFTLDTRHPDVVPLRFTRKPRAGLLFDVRSGRVLWRRNPTRVLPIASLTKMMTALLIAEREDPHDRVPISRRAVRTAGSGVGVLPRGKRVQLEALLNGLLLVSGNDAAVALAQHAAGTVPGFVRRMNLRAAQLGLRCTRFTTPHGLEDAGNHSCAEDLGALARADLAQRRIRRIARRDRAIVRFPIKGGHLFLYNNNPLIRSGSRGVTGLKTGYTDRAGRSIVATVKRGRLELGVVLLHSYNPAEQARKLFERGFKVLRTARSGG